MKTILIAASVFAAALNTAAFAAPTELTGTWTLVYADVVHPDGTRGHDYGDAPSGLLMIDDMGHYSLQIYDTARPKFAAKDKANATPDEYKSAVVGASNHFGTLTVDPVKHSFTLNLVSSSYPNQEGATQIRAYDLKDGVLSYKVAARSNGDVPISAWKRVNDPLHVCTAIPAKVRKSGR